MQLGEKKLIVQRASVGAKGGLPPEVIICVTKWVCHTNGKMFKRLVYSLQ